MTHGLFPFRPAPLFPSFFLFHALSCAFFFSFVRHNAKAKKKNRNHSRDAQGVCVFVCSSEEAYFNNNKSNLPKNSQDSSAQRKCEITDTLSVHSVHDVFYFGVVELSDCPKNEIHAMPCHAIPGHDPDHQQKDSSTGGVLPRCHGVRHQGGKCERGEGTLGGLGDL